MTKKKLDKQGVQKASNIKRIKVAPTIAELATHPPASNKDTIEAIFRINTLASMYKLTVPEPITNLAQANDLLGQVIDVVRAPKFVFHATVEINVPTEYSNGKVVHEGFLLSLPLMFDKYPDAFAVEQAVCRDEFLRALPNYETISRILSFCLATWGIPNLPTPGNKMYGERSSMECFSVRTSWVANVIEKDGSLFDQNFGSIFITHKPIN